MFCYVVVLALSLLSYVVCTRVSFLSISSCWPYLRALACFSSTCPGARAPTGPCCGGTPPLPSGGQKHAWGPLQRTLHHGTPSTTASPMGQVPPAGGRCHSESQFVASAQIFQEKNPHDAVVLDVAKGYQAHCPNGMEACVCLVGYPPLKQL